MVGVLARHITMRLGTAFLVLSVASVLPTHRSTGASAHAEVCIGYLDVLWGAQWAELRTGAATSSLTKFKIWGVER